MEDKQRSSNAHLSRVPKGENRETDAGNVFEKIMAENSENNEFFHVNFK